MKEYVVNTKIYLVFKYTGGHSYSPSSYLSSLKISKVRNASLGTLKNEIHP